jgi:hypothetical protein
MSAAWRALSDELARWSDAGRAVEFWWRDDDAARPAPALSRLLALAQASGTPLALAVIPLQAESEIFERMGAGIAVLQHGSDHRNRAAAGEKKTEFPAAESVASAVPRLVAARDRLSVLAGSRLLPVLAPPWNRLPETYAPRLAAAGFRGLTRYGPRAAAQAAPGLAQVNTHVDLIDWRGQRGFAGEEAVLAAAVKHLAAKRQGRADAMEATGWLSHHAIHDEPAWNFLERLFQTAREHAPAGVRWLGARELFHIS